ncbi:MAG: hypothetical protein K6F79_09335 [Saccharofermentans sp.]|nr:hypothetical protein [Saccharofermentans sp.]
MPNENFNINDKSKDAKSHKIAVYTICVLVLLLTVLLDIYFLTGILE